MRRMIGAALVAACLACAGCSGQVRVGSGFDREAAGQAVYENVPAAVGGAAGAVATAATGQPAIGAGVGQAVSWGLQELLLALGIGGGGVAATAAAASKASKEREKKRGIAEAKAAKAEGVIEGLKAKG